MMNRRLLNTLRTKKGEDNLKKKRRNFKYSGTAVNQPGNTQRAEKVQVHTSQKKPVSITKSGGCGCGKKLKRKD